MSTLTNPPINPSTPARFLTPAALRHQSLNHQHLSDQAVSNQHLSNQHLNDLLCWSCANPLASLTAATSQTCPACDAVTLHQDGIWHSLSPAGHAAYQRFITEYEHIRHSEGRASQDPAYYRALPFADLSGKLSAQWHIRARTFRHLERHVLPSTPARILDLGAGNCWLSHRLALLGHHPVAVDLLTNATDGLGAATHYPVRFPRVQASLTALPFPSATFDLALFNASFHYAQSFAETFAEALRCTRPGGHIVIADTPWYPHESQGSAMVQEKHAQFQHLYGFPSNSIPSQEFLTPARLQALGLPFRVLKPWYGLPWALRPLVARLKRRRTPSRFRLFVAQVPA